MFESRVVLDGSQTTVSSSGPASPFESRVVLDGSQTITVDTRMQPLFESRVALDGSQIGSLTSCQIGRLRVVLF